MNTDLRRISRIVKGDILKMTTVAASGHPGGSISSADLFLSVLLFSSDYKHGEIIPHKVKPRGKFIISHGHTAPGWYASLGRLNLIDDEYLYTFRKYNSKYSGHVERNSYYYSDWATGSLGQGLSAAAGKAIAQPKEHVWVFMGDGEQQKGQISEARRFINKYKLHNITAIIDYNGIQINGDTDYIMPQDIKREWESNNFKVLEINGHDFEQIFNALETSKKDNDMNYLILAKTISGKDISFMENNCEYVSRALNLDECKAALSELQIEDDLDYLMKKRRRYEVKMEFDESDGINKEIGIEREKVFYESGKKIPCRQAFGDTITELVNEQLGLPIYVFDCDLSKVFATNNLSQQNPTILIQDGIQEHHAVACAGALSSERTLTFFSTFAKFGMTEVLHQHMLNELNNTNLKIILSHSGLAGEDGPSHHCTNLISLVRSLRNTELIYTGDANQTKHIIRYVSRKTGNYCVALGRVPTSVICNEDGSVFYGKDYQFNNVGYDIIRKSNKNYIISYGNLLSECYEAVDFLRKQGYDVGLINLYAPLCKTNLLKDILCDKKIFLYEEHDAHNGLASILINDKSFDIIVSRGFSTTMPSGNYFDLLAIAKLNRDSIILDIKKEIGE